MDDTFRKFGTTAFYLEHMMAKIPLIQNMIIIYDWIETLPEVYHEDVLGLVLEATQKVLGNKVQELVRHKFVHLLHQTICEKLKPRYKGKMPQLERYGFKEIWALYLRSKREIVAYYYDPNKEVLEEKAKEFRLSGFITEFVRYEAKELIKI